MKKIFNVVALFCAGMLVSVSCSESFLNQAPTGVYSASVLNSKKGVEGAVINTYASLIHCCDWYATPNNWFYGSVLGGEAYKGSFTGDQTVLNPLIIYKPVPSNDAITGKWKWSWDGVGQANSAIATVKAATALSEADSKALEGEARFIRGLYYLELRRIFKNVPFVDENTSEYRIPNDTDIYSKIEDDFKFGYENMPATAPALARANKWAAAAFLAKTYLDQGKYTEALPVLNDIYTNGTTAKGVKYALNAKYGDNFKVTNENSAESVFAIQYSVQDGSGGNNGNYENILNYPYGGGPGGCCGFYQPSQSLVNSFKTSSGLPLLDTFNDSDVTSDMGKTANDKTYMPYTGEVDPRLDWTVGRRDVPYLDWGLHPGVAWIRDQAYGGPYAPVKNVYYKADAATSTQAGGWGQMFNANNYNLIRFAEVILWLAECEAEVGDPEKARAYVNQLRTRAANTAGFVMGRFTGYSGDDKVVDATQPAANYVISNYSAAWDKPTAIKAIRFERKLELGMEGHRFFDLVRWGVASTEIASFIAADGNFVNSLSGASFTAGVNEYFPIPQSAITQSFKDGAATLTQNPGY